MSLQAATREKLKGVSTATLCTALFKRGRRAHTGLRGAPGARRPPAPTADLPGIGA